LVPAAAGGGAEDEIVAADVVSAAGSDTAGADSPADCNCTLVNPLSTGDSELLAEPNIDAKDIPPLARASLDATLPAT
jgi:hypothetical protein